MPWTLNGWIRMRIGMTLIFVNKSEWQLNILLYTLLLLSLYMRVYTAVFTYINDVYRWVNHCTHCHFHSCAHRDMAVFTHFTALFSTVHCCVHLVSLSLSHRCYSQPRLCCREWALVNRTHLLRSFYRQRSSRSMVLASCSMTLSPSPYNKVQLSRGHPEPFVKPSVD